MEKSPKRTKRVGGFEMRTLCARELGVQRHWHAPGTDPMTGQHDFLMLSDTVLSNSITRKRCQAILVHSFAKMIIVSQNGSDLHSFSFCYRAILNFSSCGLCFKWHNNNNLFKIIKKCNFFPRLTCLLLLIMECWNGKPFFFIWAKVCYFLNDFFNPFCQRGWIFLYFAGYLYF